MRFKYCPICAGKLKDKTMENGRKHLVCCSCGFIFFQNSKPTASAIIENERGETLLLKRAIEPSIGRWDTFGGFLENGEHPIDGLKREAMEELSLDISPGGIISVIIDKYEDYGQVFHTLNIFYSCKISSADKIKLDHENSQYKWFLREQIPWDSLAFKNTTLALKSFYNIV
jgi:ADP-ribose pyrophosphatase YjhB (NUDIX family)